MNKLIVVLALFLSGCATPGMWTNPDKNQAQFEEDRLSCWQAGEQYAANISAHGNPILINQRARECMTAKGYKWQAKPK